MANPKFLDLDKRNLEEAGRLAERRRLLEQRKRQDGDRRWSC